MRLNPAPSSYEIILSRRKAASPDAVVTTTAPAPADQTLYVSAGGCLYALDARDGTARWCQQVELIWGRQIIDARARAASEHPLMSFPPPPKVAFATPRVVDGVVYVCVDGYGDSYTCAFDAEDGALRWHTSTDGRIASMPLMDWAAPLVNDGAVYSGTYALNAQDGAVLWRTAIDTSSPDGTLMLHTLVDETIYATTHMGIYAINAVNARNGQIRWRHPPDAASVISGPSVVAGHLLYAGMSGAIGRPEKDGFFALDVATGAEVWRYRMGGYIGAVVQDESVYVSSGDRFLYAFATTSGGLRWRRQFASSALSSVAIAEDILYITIGTDGVYALRSEDGAILWREPLGNEPGVWFSFYPPFVLDGAVYVARRDKRGKSVLFALDARTGAECWRWHTSPPSAIAPLAAAQ